MFDNMFSFDNIGVMLQEAGMRVIPALICITFHELAHGYTAYRLGDRTAKDMGRLTLNPIKHIDIIGLLMMMFFRFGWAKPVPVNMYNFKRPKWYMAMTAIAGPLSNFILAIVVMALFGLLITLLGGYFVLHGDMLLLQTPGAGGIALTMLYNTAFISVALAVFNLMPVPPLDGSKVLFSILPERAYVKLMRYERYGMILLVIFLTTPFFRETIGRLTFTLISHLDVIWRTMFRLVN